MGTEPNGNLCWFLSLYSVNTSIQFYTIHFYWDLYPYRCYGLRDIHTERKFNRKRKFSWMFVVFCYSDRALTEPGPGLGQTGFHDNTCKFRTTTSTTVPVPVPTLWH